MKKEESDIEQAESSIRCAVRYIDRVEKSITGG